MSYVKTIVLIYIYIYIYFKGGLAKDEGVWVRSMKGKMKILVASTLLHLVFDNYSLSSGHDINRFLV